jgi:hypothetical protein
VAFTSALVVEYGVAVVSYLAVAKQEDLLWGGLIFLLPFGFLMDVVPECDGCFTREIGPRADHSSGHATHVNAGGFVGPILDTCCARRVPVFSSTTLHFVAKQKPIYQRTNSRRSKIHLTLWFLQVCHERLRFPGQMLAVKMPVKQAEKKWYPARHARPLRIGSESGALQSLSRSLL